MKPKTTRTLNPLPFQDLEPHRFEDLVRQLAYDFRVWKQIEPTGRGGSDEGIDIRAVELVAPDADEEADAGTDERDEPSPAAERLWIFQCKREKTIAPKRMRKVVAESLREGQPTPHGFVLAAACDFSKQARDVFREEMVARQIGEFHLWGRSDLEDMLFQQKNDHLLFVYFNLSLQPRRRSLRTQLRSVVATKKQLHALLEGKRDEDRGYGRRLVLLRDANDKTYVERVGSATEPDTSWLLCEYVHLGDPEGVLFIVREHYARVSPDRTRWDAILDYNLAPRNAAIALPQSSYLRENLPERLKKDDHVGDFFREYVAEQDRAWLRAARLVPFARVLAIDPVGDAYYPVPHIFVEFDGEDGPFMPGRRAWFEAWRSQGMHEMPEIGDETREPYFPDPIPSSVFPAPATVTHPLPVDVTALNGAIAARIDEAMRKLSGTPSPRFSSSEPEERAAKARERMTAFREWRDRVAVPVFAAAVARVQSEGHMARVDVRTVDVQPHPDSASESVELRLHLKMPLHHNPDYTRQGQLSYSIYGVHRDVEMAMDPLERDTGNRSRYGGPERTPPLTFHALTPDRVQNDIATLIERLAVEQWP